MNCDAVREQLGEHVLGTLDPGADAEIRRHLRGCMGCRQELGALEEGMSTFARAAHQVDPPPALKERVLGVLEEEQQEAPSSLRRKQYPVRRIALAAAAFVVLAGSVSVAAIEFQRAQHEHSLAAGYTNLLKVLGGKDVRVGTLHPATTQDVRGSVIMYDSDVGQSWILVLVRSPGATGSANVTVSSPKREIELHPLTFASGEASPWLVTGSDISRFNKVRIVAESGQLLASGRAAHQD